MTHFSLEEWVDFARLRVTPECESRMQEHLAAGCAVCVHTLELWLGVLEVASTLDTHRPPDGGVRIAKALYKIVPPQTSRFLNVELARLIEPAVLDLAAEGVRAVEFYRRHFLFQRGGLLLDVQIEFQPDSGWISLAGQILDPRQPSSKFGDRLVTLMSDNAELARAVSNQFGEFHMEFRPAENVMLVINLEGDSLLVTPLPYSLWEMTLPSSGSDSTTEDDDARNF